jgi:hypothetical protein
MSADAVNKKELFRLMSPKWRRRNTQRRWEYMCELRDAGASWAAMGRAINRHYTTAKKLWKCGWLERQCRACKCPVCGTLLWWPLQTLRTRPKSFIIYAVGASVWDKRLPVAVQFHGACAKCVTARRSQVFKLNSLEEAAPPKD